MTDLIVSLAVVGIAVSIFLPAIQSAREAARLNICETRLAQIGIDTQFYHDVHGRLPMALGAQGTVPWGDWTSLSNGSYWGWQQNTSPIALAASVSTSFDIEPIAFDYTTDLRGSGPNGSNRFFYDLDGWVELSSQQPARFLCPALSRLNNARPSSGVDIAHQPVTFDNSSAALGALFDTSPSATYGRSNYAGCLGADTGYVDAPSIYWQYRGMITSRELVTNDQVSLADGLSNTFVFGENIGDIRTVARSTTLRFANSWLSGGVVSGRGRAAWLTAGNPENPLLGHALNSSRNGFGSFHRDGVNFLFGDGSVHRIPRDVDMFVYYAFCGAFDTQ